MECNRHLKFSYLFDIARGMGADFLATGHYAIIKKTEDGYGMFRGVDPLKDQSYFLYCLKKAQLGNLLFPLGGMEKKEIRKIAAGLNLPSAAAPESRDICFVTTGDYGQYLKGSGVKPKPGLMVDMEGKRLGKHDGFFNFTVGQRRGTGVYGGLRLYVTELRPGTNEVVLGPLEAAHASGFTVSGLNWLAPVPDGPFESAAQIRYRHKPAACRVEPGPGHSAKVIFEKPQFAIAPGQSVVFYDGDRVTGGGIISGR